MTPRIISITLIFSFVFQISFSQVGISDTGSFTPDPKAVIDMRSISKGMLIPRLTTGQISAIQDPPDGLIVYNTEMHSLFIYNSFTASWGSIAIGDVNFSPGGCGLPFTDSRDGKIYNTVLIGNQCWMKENLDVGTRINGTVNQTDNAITEKYCYADDPANCTLYGGLYQWNELMQYVTDSVNQGICPEGWRVPTDYEWKVLEGTVDGLFGVGSSTWEQTGFRGFNAGYNLKAQSGWSNGGNGSDGYGFKALPGGYRNLDGIFYGAADLGKWWASIQDGSGFLAWRRFLQGSNDGISRSLYDKNWGLSVRCIKD